MGTIRLADATVEQLRTFATTHLGIEVHPNSNRITLLAKIGEVHQGDEMPAIGAPEVQETRPAQPAGVRPLKRDAAISARAAGDPIVVLTIHEQETEEGKRPVPLQVNGTNFLVERGKLQEVPYRYFLALMNAEKFGYTQDKDGNLVETRAPQYPFSVLESPSRAEVAAWFEATKDLSAAPDQAQVAAGIA